MKKKGQLELSFGMIFSILIIIATLAIAFYVIFKFMQTQECINVGLFFDGLNGKIEEAYKATIVSDSYTSNIPSGITAVCFGYLNQSTVTGGGDSTKQNELKANPATRNSGANVFFYPLQQGCGGKFPYHKESHAVVDGFFCINVENGKLTVKLEKDAFESLVTLSK